ncbi:hypothetical protein BG006_001014 [Podila minutissima]|uniref:CTLH domain-containing protein n=1 Tax=Podila minutissima TaxID=64525 RepID=A0A9P5VPI2_9FUNG|nr:hypothetical protein BG006_001014 [Podila minutissima]
MIPESEKHNTGASSSSRSHGTDTDMAPNTTTLGFDRVEIARLMIQSLKALGYKHSAQTLATEAGCELESQAVAQFRECVLSGAWDTVEQLSEQLDIDPVEGLPTVKFLIREQKFLELLESGHIKSALVVLRSELTPLNKNMERVHTLTSFMMTSGADDLRQRAEWDGSEGTSRRKLLASLQKFISPAVMVPEHRLETLLKQATEQQIKNCFYHDSRSDAPYSLYSDHVCDKVGIPSVTRQVLEGHTNEVWYISFSHDGKYLASTSVDFRVIIWDLETFKAVHTLQGHTGHVSCCSWSPDDSLLVTAGFDKTVKLWDTQTGTLKSNFQKHPDIVTCLGWLPDSNRFISGSEKFMLLMATSGDVLHTWSTPVRDLAITTDGRILVATNLTNIRQISLVDMTEISRFEEMDDITAISLSRDNRHLLVNTTVKPTHLPMQREVHLWDLREGKIKRKYSGYQQGRFVIRPCFGGGGGDGRRQKGLLSEDDLSDESVQYKERFVVSGSEDSKIHLWHRDNGHLVQTFEGHTKAVTCVAWHPTNPTMFASASDDHTIRIWGTPEDAERDMERTKDVDMPAI